MRPPRSALPAAQLRHLLTACCLLCSLPGGAQGAAARSGGQWCARGLRKVNACCAPSCLQCGGPGCQGACCGSFIETAGACRHSLDVTCLIPQEDRAPSPAELFEEGSLPELPGAWCSRGRRNGSACCAPSCATCTGYRCLGDCCAGRLTQRGLCRHSLDVGCLIPEAGPPRRPQRWATVTPVADQSGWWTSKGTAGYWSSPEDSVPHLAAPASDGVAAEDLDEAFPDLNCDRAEGGRWRALRRDLEALAEQGFGQGSPADLLRWRGVLESLESERGISGWLPPAGGETWVNGHGVEANATLACPLGVATVLALSLLVHLAEVFAHIAGGREHRALAMMGAEYTRRASALQLAVMRAFSGGVDPLSLMTLLPAARWPLLDVLAWAEEHVLGTVRAAVLQARGVGTEDCLAGADPLWETFVETARSLAGRRRQGPGSANVAVKSSESALRLMLQIEEMEANLGPAWEGSWQCMPRWLLYKLGCGMICIQGGLRPHGNPEACIHANSAPMMMIFWPPHHLAEWLVAMDWARFRVFGTWLLLRELALHRLELPFRSAHELGTALGLQVSATLPDRSGTSLVRSAVTALKTQWDPALPPSQRIAFLSACWGEKHARRLGLWLAALHRAQVLRQTVIMCHDTVALEACASAHQWPDLCADARAWPKSLLSKLVGLALCLELGVDVMWLDSDAVVLRDPRPQLLPMSGGEGEVAQQPEFLFSVEPDSWNCINAGVFFVRSTPRSLRYFGHWLALFLARPFTIDQVVLFTLLGLVHRMDFAAFASRERLLDRRAAPARLLGTLGTPAWGALDGQRAFGMTAQVVTGGIERGAAGELAVMHLLDSWPMDNVEHPLYHDAPDVVYELLAGLNGTGRGVEGAMELVRRSEHSFRDQIRRDCRTSYIHGR